MAPLNKKIKETILDHYYTLGFPGSFGSLKKFRIALKEQAGIDISSPALRRLMKNNLFYQTHLVKPKKFPTRKVYSRGVGKMSEITGK